MNSCSSRDSWELKSVNNNNLSEFAGPIVPLAIDLFSTKINQEADLA